MDSAAQRESPMHLCRVEWFLREAVSDADCVFYEIMPYSSAQADWIIRDLCGLVALDPRNASPCPTKAQQVRRAFELIVGAARDWQARSEFDRRVKDADAAFARHERKIGRPPWRKSLPDLAHGRRRFDAAVGDKSVRLVLKWGLGELGQEERAGRRWLHYLRDHPDVLLKTIDRVLSRNSLLYNLGGRPERWELVDFVLDVGRAYEILTGMALSRGVTSTTRSRQGGKPAGRGIRFVQICLQPLDPNTSDEAIAWTIRYARVFQNLIEVWFDVLLEAALAHLGIGACRPSAGTRG